MAPVLRDESGNERHGEYHPHAPPATPAPPGIGRNARSFNSDLTDVEEWADASAVVPELATAEAVTIAAWCRPGSSASTGGGKVPFAFNATTQIGNDVNRAMVRYDTLDFPDRYAIIDQADPIATGAVADPIAYPVLTYQFVAMTITSTELRLVVNGIETASKSTTLAMPEATDRFTIGAELDLPDLDPSDFWEGRLDELLVFDRLVADADLATLTAIGLGAIQGDYLATELALEPVALYTFDGTRWAVGRTI
jgi:hypothetical protein